MFRQGGACPLPNAACLALASEAVAVSRYGGRMPLLEPDIGIDQVYENSVSIVGLSSGRAQSRRWRCFLNAVIDEMARGCVSMVLVSVSVL